MTILVMNCSSDRAEVEPLWKDVEAGHIRAVSIGYQVHRFEVTKQAGAPELWRAVDWTPFEISAVPIGADPAAGFRSEKSSESSLPLHPCVVHRADAPSKEKAAMDDAVTDNTDTQTRQAATEPQDRVPTTPMIDAEAIAARARDSERERVGTIYDLAGRLHLERSFADDLVKRGVTLDAARSEILDKVAGDAEKTRVSP